MIHSTLKKTYSLLISFFMLMFFSAVITQSADMDDSSVVTAAQKPFERKSINFNREWKFIRQDITDAQAVDYDDSYWYNVGLPHDFSIPYWQETSHFTGYGWYRKTFNLEQEWIGNRIFLDFEGVFHTAEVWVNGREVDTHEGGYTGFEMDITDYVKSGENLIAIRVNNTWKPDLAPRAGEHMFTGGIYRDVTLVVTSPVHVTWYGTFVQTPEISADRSKVRMQTEVKNDSDSVQTVTVVNTVYDTDGNRVIAIEPDSKSLNPGDVYNFDKTSGFLTPHLWTPDDPYMYSVKTEIFVNGQSVDQYENPLGFRWYEWTADQGFFLNGEHFWINGVNAHQDHAGWANAVTRDALFRDVSMVKETGLNFIRGSHYPHSPAYGDACDQYGLLFMSEAPFWTTAAWGEGDANYWCDGYPTKAVNEAAFEQSCLEALRDMIRINRNHPSIILWSMGNEPFFGDNHTKKKALISKMAGYAKELDPTRATTVGGVQQGANGDDHFYGNIPNVDVTSYNGDGGSKAVYQNPGRPNFVSEYGTHTANRGDSSDGYRPYYDSVQKSGDIYSYNDYAWRAGQALWCAFHHGSIMSRGYGDMGFIDYFRLPLNSWYWYRNRYTGIPREQSVNGTPARLELTASRKTIKNDGTEDTHITVTVQDSEGNWINATPVVKLEITSGPGIFPTGKSIEFKPANQSDIAIRDGKAAIEFRSYYAGTTVIRATSAGLDPVEITITTVGSGSDDEPHINTMYGSFMGEGGAIPNPIPDSKLYKYYSFPSSPKWASSNENGLKNVQDSNYDTEWRAAVSGSGQWIEIETEHTDLRIYKAKLTFKGKVYPYKLQYKENRSDDPVTIVEYDSNSVLTRPVEESLYGVQARTLRIEFINVPADEYANIAEVDIYGIDGFQYATGNKYLSDLTWESASGTFRVKKDTSAVGTDICVGKTVYNKGLGVQADSEIIYNTSLLTPGYSRFRAIACADAGVAGDPNVAIQVYGDGQLMYDKTLTSKDSVAEIDVSIHGVKELKLVTAQQETNANNIVNWADAKLIGARRSIGIGEKGYQAQYFQYSETLIPGHSFKVSADIENKNSGNSKLAAALTLYSHNGSVITSSADSLDIPRKGKEQINLSISVPEDIPVGSYTKFIVWDAESLIPVTEAVCTSRVMGDPDKAAYTEDDDFGNLNEETNGYWVNVSAETMDKSSQWKRWEQADGSVSGSEYYVDNGNGAWMEHTFIGTQVKLIVKRDGSKRGARILIDGSEAKTISANGSPEGYVELFDSGELEFGTHTIRIEPTGSFGVDCIQYYTKDALDPSDPLNRTALTAAIEECIQLNKMDYVRGWEDFASKMRNAFTVSKKSGITQNDINKALADLNAAKNALITPVSRDETKLQEAIKDAMYLIYSEDAGRCSFESRKDYTKNLMYAIGILADKGCSQNEVNQAVLIISQTTERILAELELMDLITQAEKIGAESGKYTKESYEKVAEALAAAKSVNKADADAVKKAAANLKDAISKLVLAQNRLAVPGSLKSAQSGTKEITLTWNKVSGAKSYNIYRSSKATSGFVKIGNVSTTVYKDKKVKAGSVRYYKVTALGATAELNSARSGAVKARLMKAPVITVQSKKTKKVTVKWKAVAGAKGYKIYTSTKKSGKYKVKSTVKKGKIKNKTLNLKKKRVYYIKVKAYTTFGKKTILSPFSKSRKVKN